MLLTLLTAAAATQAPKYDVFLGMSTQMVQDVRMMMKAMELDVWTPSVEATSKVGSDTLVMWTWPLKGNHGIGVQVYGQNGKFKTRLEDSNIPSARAVVCQNRYVVGGGNTLRVWDARQNYKLISRRTFPDLSQFAQLGCQGNVVLAENKRLLLPKLSPLGKR